MVNQSSATPASESLTSVRASISEHRSWFMILGGVLILLGVIAVAFPLITTIAAKIFLGWIFLVSGLVQIVQGFSTKKWNEFFLNVLVGVLYIVAGGWLAFFPLTGVLTLTLLLAFMFIVQGVIEVGMALRLRPVEGWVWMLIAGAIAGAVSIMILAKLPSSAAWAIGLLVGVNMISSGWAYFFLALAAGKKGNAA